MRKKIFSGILVFLLVTLFNAPILKADERDEQISVLKTQVEDLLKRIEKLEAGQAKAKEESLKAKEELAKIKETTQTVQAARVDLANPLAKLKLKGRAALGFFDSGKAGSYPSGSFEVPEAKLQFGFQPDDINNIILRFNLNNATFNNVDYFYVDTDLKKLLNLGFPISSRLGKMKVDFGEETWGNNSVESVLPSASAANVNGNDEGLQLSGKLGKDKPLGYSIAVDNGSAGTGFDTSTAKAFAGKLYYNIIDPLYISASYYNSGQMKASNSELGIGGLVSPPTGAVKRTRQMWEVDLPYDFQKGKTMNPPAFCDSKAFVRLSYGGFSDDVSGGTISKRDGTIGFIEGTYNLTKKFYVATRASFIDLDGTTTATLNRVTANKYDRYSLGGGYRLSNNILLKLGYDWNRSSGPGLDDAGDNLLAAIVASQF